MSLKICDWKHGKRWVYSITYDEALADVESAILFHIDTFGADELDLDSPVLDVFVAEAGIDA